MSIGKRWRPRRHELAAAMVTAALVSGGAIGLALANDAESDPTGRRDLAAPTQTVPVEEFVQLGLSPVAAEEIAARVAFGRLRVVPAGGPVEWDSAFLPEARVQVGEVPERALGRDALGPISHPFPALRPPAGYEVVEERFLLKSSASTFRTLVKGGFTLTAPDRHPILVDFWNLRLGATVELAAWNTGGSTLWRYTPPGVPVDVLVRAGSAGAGFQQILEAHLVRGDFYARVDAPGLTAAELLALLDTLAEDAP